MISVSDQTATITAPAVAEIPLSFRWVVVSLLFLATVINYSPVNYIVCRLGSN